MPAAAEGRESWTAPHALPAARGRAGPPGRRRAAPPPGFAAAAVRPHPAARPGTGGAPRRRAKAGVGVAGRAGGRGQADRGVSGWCREGRGGAGLQGVSVAWTRPGAAARSPVRPHLCPAAVRSPCSFRVVSARLARGGPLWRGRGAESGPRTADRVGRGPSARRQVWPREPALSLLLQARVPFPDLSSRHGTGKAVRSAQRSPLPTLSAASGQF